MRLKITIILILASSLYANCKVDYSVLYAIASNERSLSRDIGYPYLISFNISKEAIKIKKTLPKLVWIDNRTIDCQTEDKCKKLLYKLNKMEIKNLDLGAFQINQNHFTYEDFSNYFNLKKSYQNACNIIYGHYKETGVWDWKTIARYHSKTPKINARYASRLQNKYIKITQRGIK